LEDDAIRNVHRFQNIDDAYRRQGVVHGIQLVKDIIEKITPNRGVSSADNESRSIESSNRGSESEQPKFSAAVEYAERGL